MGIGRPDWFRLLRWASEQVKNNTYFMECNMLLKHRNQSHVVVEKNSRSYQIGYCKSFTCKAIFIKEKRSNNDDLCFECKNQQKNQVRSERKRKEKGDTQVALDSKTPISTLTNEQISKSLKLYKVEHKSPDREIKSLKRE